MLIELIIVITILVILAAFAIPKFASLEVETRMSATRALESALRSKAALAHALWLAQGSPAVIKMGDRSVAIEAGYPDLASIDDTLDDLSGFSYERATGVFSNTDAAGACSVTYSEASQNGVPGFKLDLSGC